MTAFYSWTNQAGRESKKHLSHGGETMCGMSIPSRHTYNAYSSGDVCFRCQKAYVKEIKELHGDEWKEWFNQCYAPDIEI